MASLFRWNRNRGETKKSPRTTTQILSYPLLYKVVTVGDCCTGKTSISAQLMGNQFDYTYISTIGVEINLRVFEMDGNTFRVQIWEIPGNPRFLIRPENPPHYRGARGVFIVYDATKKKTFDNVPFWIRQVDSCASPGTKVMLVGNKCDCIAQKEVDYETARDFADERQIPFFEASAKDGTNVELAFTTLVAQIDNSRSQTY